MPTVNDTNNAITKSLNIGKTTKKKNHKKTKGNEYTTRIQKQNQQQQTLNARKLECLLCLPILVYSAISSCSSNEEKNTITKEWAL